MITVTNLGVQYGGTVLFQHVDLQFTGGNCYGIIGANGAGKSTFLKILSGELDSTNGEVVVKPGVRMSVLKQDQFQYDDYTIMDTVIMGNGHLYDIMKQKDALYEKEDFTDEDGILAAELEAEFADLGGWEAESDASQLLQGLGIPVDLHYDRMGDTDGRIKLKVLLAQALFGNPDIVMLDEPTNNLDIASTEWLEDFLLDFPGMVIVVSHDRHFLNTVCTHIVDIDYGKIKMYVGNYDFWYESSQLVQSLIRNQNKRNEEKIKELQEFIARFSANKSKSKQATSRRKLLDKLTVEEMPASSRRYPFVGFKPDREAGKDILMVDGISKTIDGVKLLDKVSFTAEPRRPGRSLSAKMSWRRPPCSGSSWGSWSRTRAASNGAPPPRRAICPRITPSTSTAAPSRCSTGCASSPPIRPRPICAAFWAGCCSPATISSSRSMCSPAVKKSAVCSPA